MPDTAILPRPKVRAAYASRGVEMPIVGNCDACGRMTYPSYTADAPDGVPELFEVDAITRVMTLCTICLMVLEARIAAALTDRLVIAEGGPL